MSTPLVILGAGESGMGAARLAKKVGLPVFLSDSGKIADSAKQALEELSIPFEEGGHGSQVLEAREVVKSPGIPADVPVLESLREQGASVISEVEFASRYTDARLVGITGTNGKTTTATLVHHILSAAGEDAVLAGNVGNSFAGAVADRDPDIFVLELSSFQLDDIDTFSPDVAVLLNITPDHLDRYPDFQAYADAKFRIAENQDEKDWFIYNYDDRSIQEALGRHSVIAKTCPISQQTREGMWAWMEEERFLIQSPEQLNTNTNTFSMSIYDLALQGRHNLYNSMAAGVAARVLEIRNSSIRESLSDFQNVEHRLELVSTVNGIEYINDSKATNINATWYALECIDKPVVWIAGGVDKGNDYEQIKDLVKSKVKAIICLGKDNKKLLQAFDGVVEEMIEVQSAVEAVGTARLIAERGDTVLLSPACASFDLFENYEERGQRFKQAVKAL